MPEPAVPRYVATPVADVLERVRKGRPDAPALDAVAALLAALQRVPPAAAPVGDELAQLRAVLRAANWVEVPREVLVRALGTSAVSRVRVELDLEAFDSLVLFRRRSSPCTAEVGRWVGWRRREVVAFQEYDRVVLHARFHPAEELVRRGTPPDDVPVLAGTTHLKLFQDVPEPDLEMLVPGTAVTMRTVDKVLLGVPALVSGVVVAVTKLGAALVLAALLVAASLGLREDSPDIDTGALVTLLGGALALGGFLWRQWSKIRTRRVDYLRRLSESLYLKTVADGPRVLQALREEAHEQELVEVLLAYRALLDGPCAAEEAGRRAQVWHATGAVEAVVLEAEEALARLAALGLAHERQGTWTAVPAEQAVRVLRARWEAIGDALAGPGA